MIELINLLPKKYYLYQYDIDDNTTTFFISTLITEDITEKHVSKSIAFIEIFIDTYEYSIRYISVSKEFRKQYIGTFLMLFSALYVKINYKNIKLIELDDMTDNYKLKNNIYTLLGFKYTETDGGPEMECNIDEVLIHKKYFIKKCINRGFF